MQHGETFLEQEGSDVDENTATTSAESRPPIQEIATATFAVTTTETTTGTFDDELSLWMTLNERSHKSQQRVR